MQINSDDKIFVAGHKGMLGSATVRELTSGGYGNIVTRDKQSLDLLDQRAVYDFFDTERPQVVIMTAARVGGIQANLSEPARFLVENLEIQNNLFTACLRVKPKKIVFVGSSCIYPRNCPQPMKEEHLLTGPLEPTNEGYAIAKIAGLKTAYYYKTQYGLNTVSLMPCNLYGPNDSFDLKHSHVLSALVRRFTDAKDEGAPSVTLWGTGSARREFMHVDDAAASIVHFMAGHDDPAHINVGVGTDVTIRELAGMISGFVGYEGRMEWDTTKPDGMPRKCLDVSRMLELGFRPAITLEEGVKQMISIYNKLKTTML